jgi:chromosome segregation ATPase
MRGAVMSEPRNICTEAWCIQHPSGAAERINDLEEANNEYNVEIERRKIEKASMQVRIAELEAEIVGLKLMVAKQAAQVRGLQRRMAAVGLDTRLEPLGELSTE